MPKFRFSVDWGTIKQNMAFQEVSGLEAETQIIEYRASNSAVFSTVKMPGIAKYGNVTMKRGVFVKDNSFWTWYNQIKMNTIKRQTVTVKLLDENGKEFSSVNFSAYLQKRMNTGLKRLVFIIGGPYGFSTEVYSRANSKLSLSKMTFSHQMIRVFFIEQLYRAFTILRNEPYHHQ